VPLTPPDLQRELVHTRAITINGYHRSDGLFDVEGHLQDVRPHDVSFPGGKRAGGEPIHDMWLRLTVDGTALIMAVSAHTDAGPFGRACAAITPAYEGLVGMRVGPGFRGKTRELFSGLKGCTHLSELLLAMGTGIVQTLAGNDVSRPEDARPWGLDGCHALDIRGPIVATYHPRWYRPSEEPNRSD
jgi:hypothetical protein